MTIRTRSRKNLHDLLDPLSINDVFDRASRYEDDGALEKAQAGYRQILQVRPEHTQAAVRQAQLLIRMKRYADAAQVVQPLTEREPENAEAWRLLGNAQLALRSFDRAAAAFGRAIQLDGQVTDHFLLGCAFQQQGLHERAMHELERATQCHAPDDAAKRVQQQARQLLAKFADAKPGRDQIAMRQSWRLDDAPDVTTAAPSADDTARITARSGPHDTAVDDDERVPGMTVQLLDARTLQVVAETVTDDEGRYGFDAMDDGDYKIRLIRPDGYAFFPQE